MRKYTWLIFGLSCLGTLATVMQFNPVSGDVMFLQFCLAGRDIGYGLLSPFEGVFHWQCPGYICWTRWLFGIIGPSLMGFRLAAMIPGLMAYGILAYVVRKSPLAVIGLAGLMWTPLIFANMREIRYDTINLLVIALNILWLTGPRNRLCDFTTGVANGLMPLFALQGIFVAMTVIIVLGLRHVAGRRRPTSRESKPTSPLLLYLCGFFIAGMITIHYFPADKFSYEMTTVAPMFSMHQRIGYQLLGQPWELVKYFCHVSFRPFHGLFDPTTWALYPVLFLIICWHWKRPPCLFTLIFLAVHCLFSASMYPTLLNPLMIMAGLSCLEES